MASLFSAGSQSREIFMTASNAVGRVSVCFEGVFSIFFSVQLL